MIVIKKYLAGLLFILVLVSCTTKKENKDQAKEIKVASGSIGVNNNGEYQITVNDTISKKWEMQLKENFGLSDSISFTKFEIVKTTTQGDAAEDSYLLITHTSDNRSAIALILDRRGDYFYFYTQLSGKAFASHVIMCSSNRGELGCTPVVLLHNTEKDLICSSDSDCQKTVSIIIL